jgi:hypothetical protein
MRFIPKRNNAQNRSAEAHARSLDGTAYYGPTFGLRDDLENFNRYFEVYFADSPPAEDEPVTYFQHIRKTAGSSLRQVIYHNYTSGPKRARHVVYGAPNHDRAELSREWCLKLVESLTPVERTSITCVVSHSANHLMHVLDRPSRAITILRDPVDRVMSEFHFTRKDRGFGVEEIFDSENVAQRKHSATYFNGQARSLLEPISKELPKMRRPRGAPPYADILRDSLFRLLDERYFVGTQDRFEESAEFFAEALGWAEVFVPRVKRNSSRPRTPIDEGLRSLILEYNWLDAEIYDRYAQRPLGALA